MSIYNEDELVAPSWINQDFLKKVLNQYEEKEGVEIINSDISPASMKGDHYASIMFRCKVEYRYPCLASQNKSLIIKTMPTEEGMKREMLEQSKLFETEIDMFSKTLPKIEAILAECGEPTRLSAKLLYHSLEPHKVVIFEDLCESGYDVIRDRALSEDEIKAVYRKLAKLHAASYMLGHSEDHEIVTKYQDGICSSTWPKLDEMMVNGLENFTQMLSENAEFAVYYEKMKSMKSDIPKACRELYTAYNLNSGKGDIFVLNHGDFHMKNLMFKLNKENQMEDIIMVDYQISCYAPSNIDLTYSQYMMLSSDLRLKRNELAQYYFTEFLKILKLLNYQGDMPKYSDFAMAGIKYRHFSIFLIACFLPMVAGLLAKPLDELKDTDTAEFFENPDQLASMYRHPDFVSEIRKFMPILLSEGYLD